MKSRKSLKQYLLIIVSIVCTLHAKAQNVPSWQWGKVFRGYSFCNVVDAAGNVYIAGTIDDSAIFEGNKLETDAGGLFVAKYNSAGALLWAKGYGNNTPDLVMHGINLDKNGNIYISGDCFPSSIGTDSLYGHGGWDVFVAKLNNNGDVQWARSGGGPETDVLYKGIGVDDDGAVYISGRHDDSASFGNISLPRGQGMAIFIVKYDTHGDAVWARSYDGAGDDRANGVAADANGNVYTTGNFTGQLNMGNTSLIANRGCFTSKHDKNGNLLWAKAISSDNLCSGTAIAPDKAGNVIVTGSLRGTTSFAAATVSVPTGFDPFTAKYDKDGNELWMHTVPSGTGGYGDGAAIATDNNENVYVCGHSADGFICKYSPAGQQLWLQNSFSQSSGQLQHPEGIAVSNAGYAFVTGSYTTSAIFNGITYTPQDGNGFIAKLELFPAGMEDAAVDVVDFEVYPNPSQQNFTIRCDKPYENISLFDVTGKLLYTKPVTGQKKERMLNISHLIPGVYFIRLSGETGNMHAKFIKE